LLLEPNPEPDETLRFPILFPPPPRFTGIAPAPPPARLAPAPPAARLPPFAVAISCNARRCLNAPAFVAGSSGRLDGAAPAVVCAELGVEVMPLGANAANSMAAIMQLERNAPDDIINATVAGSAEFS